MDLKQPSDEWMRGEDISSMYEDIIGKKIPKIIVRQFKTAPIEKPKQKLDQIAKQDKTIVRKYRGGDDQQQILECAIQGYNVSIEGSDEELIQRSFKGHPLFFNLPLMQIDYLLKNMFYCTLPQGEFIFKQGDQATSYFTIEQGQVEVIINNKVVRVMKKGEYFGEIALIYNATRSASIRAVTNCGFWSLDRKTFKQSIEEHMMKEYDESRKFINKVSFFSLMTSEEKDVVAHALITTKYEQGQNILNEGDQADSYYVIKSGEVSIWRGANKIRKIGAEDIFGEEALEFKQTVKADTEVRCLSMARYQLIKILGDKI